MGSNESGSRGYPLVTGGQAMSTGCRLLCACRAGGATRYLGARHRHRAVPDASGVSILLSSQDGCWAVGASCCFAGTRGAGG